MAATPLLRTPDDIEVRSGRTGAGPTALTLVLVIAVLGAIALLRGGLVERPTGLDGGAETVTPTELTATAADVLDQASAPGGAGYTFSIIQSAALVARAGSPGIEVGDPADPGKVILVERHELATYLERGVVSDAGFASHDHAGGRERLQQARSAGQRVALHRHERYQEQPDLGSFQPRPGRQRDRPLHMDDVPQRVV